MTQDFLTLLVAALAGAIAGFGALAAYYAATHQNRLTATSFAADWMRDLRAWASEAVDVLAESGHLCQLDNLTQLDNDQQAAIRRCRMRLCALIDRGRFLLPNEIDHDYGHHKPSAYRGLRHAALDPLVAADGILEGKANLYDFPNRKVAINGAQREFVSSIQEILDPRSSNKKVAAILRNAHSDRNIDPTLGGLLPTPNNMPPGAEGLLYTASMRYAKDKH
jgi:hypothetical protein